MGINRITQPQFSPIQQNSFSRTQQALQRSMENLATGLQAPRFGNDIAGMRMGSQWQTQIRGLNESAENLQNGFNLVNVADQGMRNITNELNRIRELTLQAGNSATLDPSSLQALQGEINQNIDNIGRIANTTQYGSTPLLNGNFTTTTGIRAGTPDGGMRVDQSNLTTQGNQFTIRRDENSTGYIGRLDGGEEVRFEAGQQHVQFRSGTRPGESITMDFDTQVNVPNPDENGMGTLLLSTTNRQLNFQIGPNADQQIGLNLGDLRPQSLGLGEGRMLSDIDITQPGGVEEALNIIDEALNQTGLSQSGLGAFANRLQENASQLAVTSENITASYSGQMNTDFALESIRMATNQMLMEATFAVQTQALNLQNTMFLNLIR